MKLATLVDCHVHCDYSDDCTEKASSEIERAIELGLRGVTFTDHYDIAYPNPRYQFEFDVDERKKYIFDLCNRYYGKIVIFNGIEIGIQPHVVNASLEIVKNGQFDFVICSTHAVDGFSLCSQSDFFEGKTQEQAYRRYLEEIYAGITSFSDYDVVGHIGYIRRYGPYSNKSMPYYQYHDILDMILKKVIESGKGIEINMSGYAYKLGTPIPDIDILMRYRQLGGEIITMGSDAHKIDYVGGSFDKGVEILKQTGFKYVSYFRQRKPLFVCL
jgi:histidinol-phosphatase (PHP family)